MKEKYKKILRRLIKASKVDKDYTVECKENKHEETLARINLLLDGVKDDSPQYLEWRADIDSAILDLTNK